MKTRSPFFSSPVGIFCSIAIAMVYCISVLALRPASAQTPPQPPASGRQQPNPQSAHADQQEAKDVVVNGTIVKNGYAYVLRDASGTEYKLDDQNKAQRYEGMFVRVTGKLEASNNLLHVSSITESAA